MKRSKTVAQAIEWLDNFALRISEEDQKVDPWEALAQKERAWCIAEIKKSRHDFEYAAGNYFWLLHPKDSQTALLDLREPQQMLHDIIQWFWKQGKPAWIWLHKARQIGASTFVEALMTWKVVFYRHQVGMIIAHRPDHAAYMLSTMQYILMKLPWWMRPHIARCEVKEVMVIAGDDSEGMSNLVLGNSANQMSAFGQGKPIHVLHATECSHWARQKAVQIIHGDLKAALVDRPGCFAIFESKPNGATGFWHDTWCYHADQWLKRPNARNYPMFVPAFFEPSRRKKAPPGYIPSDQEIAPGCRTEVEIKQRYALDWHRCKKCGKPVYANCRDNVPCVGCGSTEHDQMILDDAQLYWYRCELEDLDPSQKEFIKKFKQEYAVTAEEGFQAHGQQIFPEDVFQAVQKSEKPGRWHGYFSEDKQFHDNGKKCRVCSKDHSWKDFPLQVWELPRPGEKYVMGVDVSYGMGADYSVASVHRIGHGDRIPDEQVAEYRSNIVSAGDLAQVIYLIARAYNDCLMAIEAHGIGDNTQYEVLRMGYGNLFRWKHYDVTKNPTTNKLGWWTNYQTKQYLIGTYISWIRRRIYLPRSPNVLHEMPTFTREYDEEGVGGAAKGSHDDAIMADMICLFCSHDEDFDYDRGRIVVPDRNFRGEEAASTAPGWICYCVCGNTWDAVFPRGERCAKCNKMVDRAVKKAICPNCGRSAPTSSDGRSILCGRCAPTTRATRQSLVGPLGPVESEQSGFEQVADFNCM